MAEGLHERFPDTKTSFVTTNNVYYVPDGKGNYIGFERHSNHYLKSFLSFRTAKDFTAFCKLTDPDYMKERIMLKESAGK